VAFGEISRFLSSVSVGFAKSQSMDIDHLNYYLGGGAAIAARRVHEGLRNAGHESTFWYQNGASPPDASYRVWQPSYSLGARGWLERAGDRLAHLGYRNRFRRALRGRPQGLELFSPAVLPHRTRRSTKAFSGDVLHLHWIGASFDYRTFFRSLPSDKQVVWTLHDMNPFTGGCHYSAGCEKFETSCGNCPQLGPAANSNGEDISSQSFAAKLDSLPLANVNVVAPSKWLIDLARCSPLLGGAASFERIPYGIDLQTFCPRDSAEARGRLGLPQDAQIIAFGADDVDNRRKGFEPLCEMLRRMTKKSNLMCVYFGRGELPLDASSSLSSKSLGFIRDKNRLADVYSAANLLVLPSIEDNSPQTGIESLACGTPVVAFDAGGISDYVQPGRSGELAPVGDVQALADAVARLLEQQADGQCLRESSRALAKELFNPSAQADAYDQLYRRILGRAQKMAA